jgi:hypothetical protein
MHVLSSFVKDQFADGASGYFWVYSVPLACVFVFYANTMLF